MESILSVFMTCLGFSKKCIDNDNDIDIFVIHKTVASPMSKTSDVVIATTKHSFLSILSSFSAKQTKQKKKCLNQQF
jgi:hypothetical protein